MRDVILIDRSIIEAISVLPDEELKEAFMMVMRYAFDGIEPDCSGILKAFFIMAKPLIDRGNYILDKQNGRRCKEYQDWRNAVYKRDNYTCQMCGAKGKLNAHHIKRYSLYPDLRYEIDNGITLCEKCHKEVHRLEREKR